MDDGFIKIHRRMLRWEWFSDVNTTHLFIYLLLSANWEDKKWQGQIIKRGQVVTGLKNLSTSAGLSIQQTRTSLKKLVSTNEITIKSTNKYSVITIEKYGDYQRKNEDSNNQITNEQQSNNKQITTTKELKELKEIYNTYNKYAYTEKQFGRVLSATEKEEITKWPDTELTMYAIKQAMLYGKSNVKYVSKIIEVYGRENIQTVQQAQQREREYAEAKKRKQNLKRNNGYQRNTKTIEPEWLNKKIEKQELTPEEREEMDDFLIRKATITKEYISNIWGEELKAINQQVNELGWKYKGDDKNGIMGSFSR